MPLLDGLLSIIAPHNCIVCGAEDGLLCAWCLPEAFPGLPSRCYRCYRTTSDSATCEHCRRRTAVKHAWIVTDYRGTAKQLVHDYKFGRARAAAPILGSVLADALPYISAHTLIVPVPTASIHIRQRGYDHALLMARYLAIRRNLRLSPIVSRLTQSRQVGSGRQQRHDQLRDAFIVTKPSLVNGAEILIVDDVLTTGATIEAVARILKQAGAKSIDAAIFAQKH